MSPNRKAEIQRKLTLAPLPKPPAGLAERIKREIPKQIVFDTEKERRRFSQSVAFNLRVAASIILLISSVYLSINLLSRGAAEKAALERTEEILNRPESTARVPSNATPMAQSAPPSAALKPSAPAAASATRAPEPIAAFTDKKSVIVAEADTGRLADNEARANRPADKREEKKLRDDRFAEGIAGGVAGGVVGGVPGGVAGGSAAGAVADEAIAPRPVATPPPAPPAAITVSAEAPVLTQPSAAKATADAQPQRQREALAESISVVRSATAADLALGKPSTLFGIDVAQHALAKDTAAGSLIQHFAAPAKAPSRSVRLEADAAPSPFDDGKQFVRVSVDMPSAVIEGHAAVPPVGSDAMLTVELDPSTVRSQRAVAGTLVPTERVLVANSSVTALYEIEIDPAAARRATIATIRLRYKRIPDGQEQTITRTIHRNDVASSWEAASQRMKAASLAASIGTAPAADISAKAKAAGLDELAAAATH